MRCPKCNQELNPHSERCPNCGTSARLAVPDGDTMTRVRRQISVMRRETEVSDVDLSDASFSPVLKFDRPEEKQPEEIIEHNPANNFPDESFDPVDLRRLPRRSGQNAGVFRVSWFVRSPFRGEAPARDRTRYALRSRGPVRFGYRHRQSVCQASRSPPSSFFSCFLARESQVFTVLAGWRSMAAISFTEYPS